jgi:hypothetical protein
MIIGERSNGKTYACLKYGIENYWNNKKQMAIVRRWDTDFIGKRGSVYFDALLSNDEVSKITGGLWTGIYYYASKWYLCTYDPDGNRITDEKPFAYAFAISQMEHDKSTSYPDITVVVFDEFISRTGYLADEFVAYMNVLSTIIRHRTDVKIFMLGNTVNKYCPYFNEMGLKHIKNMKQGTIDLYTYGDTELTVAVEYCSPISKEGKDSDVYFAFDNPKLQMITGGAWEIDLYPHCPYKYKPKDIKFTYFIQFDEDLLQCEIISVDHRYFTFIHRKTTDLKNTDKDIIYTTEYDPRPNYRRNITKPTDDLDKKIAMHYKKDKIFYQDNEVGEIVRNYLLWCTRKQ